MSPKQGYWRQNSGDERTSRYHLEIKVSVVWDSVFSLLMIYIFSLLSSHSLSLSSLKPPVTALNTYEIFYFKENLIIYLISYFPSFFFQLINYLFFSVTCFREIILSFVRHMLYYRYLILNLMLDSFRDY